MKSLHQTRENLRLIDNALDELAGVDYWNYLPKFREKFQDVVDELEDIKKTFELNLKIWEEGKLKELEAQCLENMKS